MNLKNFKSGHYVQQYQYKSFSPAPVNHTWVWDDPQINTLLEDATRTLGELNAFSLILPRWGVGCWEVDSAHRALPHVII